ncbi:nucleoside hydrolase [Cellulomonas sp. APG4]|uniref:nucleoside hydrolase n=1 Tax=Cellulomonas sp. APG4 TaxID=1538656 RepID=UPI0013799FDF|nr:nucleoside hydrolase [Cellulomonas sp. APG4]
MQSTPLRSRLLLSTDAKNEADDQFAIAHALLSPTLDLRGVLPAHFGTRVPDSRAQSRAEVDLLLALAGRTDVTVADGADGPLGDRTTARPSEASQLIVSEALAEDEAPLFVVALGPLTDVASAILSEPGVAASGATVVWIGGPPYDDVEPVYWPEYNLSNDIAAANVVFSSGLEIWQVPMDVYTRVGVSYSELDHRVRPHGRLGGYLVRQLHEWNAQHMSRAVDHRSLGDQPGIGLVLNPFGAVWRRLPAPSFNADGSATQGEPSRRVRVCRELDTRWLLEDFFHKIADHARDSVG